MATKTQDEKLRLPAHRLRALGVAACADPRTVARVVAGATNTKGLARERIEKALREAGLGHLVPGAGRDDRE